MSTAVSQRHTVSYLKRRFEGVGFEPDSRRGQNFLIDMNLHRLLIDAAQIEPCDVVLEVGTGTGSITAEVAKTAAAVISVEIDRRLHQMASEETIDFDNVTLLQIDALKNKNRMNPEVIEAVEAALAAGENRRLKLVANLPYNVATPIISNMLSTPVVPRTMTVTIQKELAQRIVARPSTKDYGALSIWLQSQCRVEIVRIMPPDVFWPRPKVESAILQLVLDDALRERIPHREFFHQFVRAMFFHRRKFLRSVLVSAVKKQLDKTEVDEILAEMDFEPDVRSEQLDVDTMLALCEKVRARLETSTL